MILMQAPGPNMTFGAAPSGAGYLSDSFGLVKVTNNNSNDQAFLASAGCYTLTPFGGWGTFQFNTLSDLYAADTGALVPGIIGFPQHTMAIVTNDAGNSGTWSKTASGQGSGNWTQISTGTPLSAAADALIAAASAAKSANDALNSANGAGISASSASAALASIATARANALADIGTALAAALTSIAEATGPGTPITAEDGTILTTEDGQTITTQTAPGAIRCGKSSFSLP